MSKSSEYVSNWIKKHSSSFGRIYKIVNVVTGETYIGRTKTPLKRRWYQHVTCANSNKSGLLYDNIRAWGKECFDIVSLYDCDAHDDISLVEIKFIKELNPELNKISKLNF